MSDFISKYCPLVVGQNLGPPFSSSILSSVRLRDKYLESFPVMYLAEAPLHLTSCTQQRSTFLLVMVSTISLDLPLMVPMFQEAILSVLCGVSHDVDLTGPLPVLLLMTPST